VRCAFLTAQVLKLRTIGLSDYSVLEGGQRIGRIRLATERMPCVWIWSVTVHLPGGLPIGSSKDLDTAKAEFKAAWKALKARTPPEQLAAAYKAMNIRDDPQVDGASRAQFGIAAATHSNTGCGLIGLQVTEATSFGRLWETGLSHSLYRIL
jgi:hypothetical protein